MSLRSRQSGSSQSGTDLYRSEERKVLDHSSIGCFRRLRFWQPQRKTTISDENFLINANYEEKLVPQKHSPPFARANQFGSVAVPFCDSGNQALDATYARVCSFRANNKAPGKITRAPTKTRATKNNTASAEETTE